MKIRFKILVIMLVVIMSSCSDSKIQITTESNFEMVEFPDGSTAYLNNNSSIEYDENFTQRIITQKGEVFYDVKKGNSPFFVKTEVGEIQVLGTKFNVKSDKDGIELEVEEGVVELKINKFISKVKKGQKAFFKESENEIKIYKAKFKHKKWIKNLNKEFKKLGIEINKSFKQIEKESKKSWKEISE
ncbi:MAG: FecR domain-containing protein [Flavobacteriaceae bacterium]|nr:FecR domain-containing protein [Flavobacteriaceae bacterium]